ncbi:hypothetical protein Vadar_020630 [Vaccinium darrowii]|uniref:Uncharacterized protein n=1 Tax=Vaccinium darrowii TaxID=229202 RepID=A0ACB7Y884_9ERIC|nr:hypothetical protein Vadar_020630 [Vaccinium darrowii]
MRIRKHAKLNGLSLTATAPNGCSPDLTPRSTSSSRLRQHNSPHICQLNQSPWDLLSFPPDSPSSPFQVVDGEESNYTANGSSGNSLGAGESVASMRMSLNVEDKNVKNGIELGFGNGGAISYCKTVGKSWQCKKEASKGHSLSQHHLPLPSAKKSEKPPVVVVAEATNPIRRRGRPRKVQLQPPPPPPPATANPYEFYYYSGFGPRWGKKRGVRDVPKSDSVEEEEEEIVREIVPQHSSLSSSSSEIDSEEFDYIEDDDDEDKEDKRNVKKRRGRKPIKARSLKSLM